MCVRCAASIEPLNRITDEGEILPDEFSVFLSALTGVGWWVCGVGSNATESGRRSKYDILI